MRTTQRLRQAIKDYREGKQEAFTLLYEESSKYVYTCIYKVMFGNDNAQDLISDIMQDTYVEISKSIAQLENEDRFLQWAGMIATRKCYAYLKKNKKYVLLNEDDDTFDSLSDSEGIIPEEIMQDREKQRLIREIIDTRLTEMQKLCIIAYYYNEQKQSEIARELGIPENTVKTNLSRAKGKIKDGVLELEKNKGTKLYSVAPFLLLLFTEDVQAAAVPEQITEGVLRVVSKAASSASASATASTTTASTAVTTGAKGFLGKIVAASLKTKVLGGIIGVGMLGAVGGTAFMASQSEPARESESVQESESAWERDYKAFLPVADGDGFDLYDFDLDGVPELILHKEETKGVYLYAYDTENNQLLIRSGIDQDVGEIDRDGDVYGYTEKNELVITGQDKLSVDQKEYRLPYYYRYGYQNLDYDRTDMVMFTYQAETSNQEPVLKYRQVKTGGEWTDLTVEEALGKIQDVRESMTLIEFTDLKEQDIADRIEEFKKYGNRKHNPNGTLPIDENIKELEEQSEEEQSEQSEITLTASQREGLEALINVLTYNTYFYEEIDGYQYPVKDVEKALKFTDLIGNLGLDNTIYETYQPASVIASDGYTRIVSRKDMDAYLKHVFGIEAADFSDYQGEKAGTVEFSMQSDPIASELTIDQVLQNTDGTFEVTGEIVVMEQEIGAAPYNFRLTAEENGQSPFGYTVKGISYAAVGEGEMVDSTNGLMAEILLYPAEHMEYYPSDADINDIWFAVEDLNGDGINEVLIGDKYWAEERMPSRIINILEAQEGTVADYDGDHIYENVSEFILYDTNILQTYLWDGWGKTSFWNLSTGEVWEGARWRPTKETEMMPAGEREEHAYLTDGNGRVYEGTEGDALYDSLSQGNVIPLSWYQVTQENVAIVLP